MQAGLAVSPSTGHLVAACTNMQVLPCNTSAIPLQHPCNTPATPHANTNLLCRSTCSTTTLTPKLPRAAVRLYLCLCLYLCLPACLPSAFPPANNWSPLPVTAAPPDNVLQTMFPAARPSISPLPAPGPLSLRSTHGIPKRGLRYRGQLPVSAMPAFYRSMDWLAWRR